MKEHKVLKNAIFIGGVPRVGKTTITELIGKKYGFSVLHMDAMKEALKATGVRFPNFGHKISWKNFDVFFVSTRYRDEVLTTAAIGYSNRILNDVDGIVVEGGLWPDLTNLDELKDNYDVRIFEAYIVDTSDIDEALIRLKTINETDESSWLRKYDDETICEYCEVNIERSKYIAETAKQTNKRYYDIVSYGYDIKKMQEQIMSDIDDFLH